MATLLNKLRRLPEKQRWTMIGVVTSVVGLIIVAALIPNWVRIATHSKPSADWQAATTRLANPQYTFSNLGQQLNTQQSKTAALQQQVLYTGWQKQRHHETQVERTFFPIDGQEQVTMTVTQDQDNNIVFDNKQ